MNPKTKKVVKKVVEETKFIVSSGISPAKYFIKHSQEIDDENECGICGSDKNLFLIDYNQTDCGDDFVICKKCLTGLSKLV